MKKINTWLDIIKLGNANKKAKQVIDQYGYSNYPEKLQYWLKELYKKWYFWGERRIIKIDALIASVFHETDDIAERALFNLYLFVADKWDEKGKELLLAICKNAFTEEKIKLRGRKHWVQLELLNEEDRITYINKVLEVEKEDYVRERIYKYLAVFSENVKYYPTLLKASINEDIEAFNELMGTLHNNYSDALNIVNWIDNNISLLIDIMKNNSNWVIDFFTIRGKQGLPFIIPFLKFKDSYLKGDKITRYALLYAFGSYLNTDACKIEQDFLKFIFDLFNNNQDGYIKLLILEILASCTAKGIYCDEAINLAFNETQLGVDAPWSTELYLSNWSKSIQKIFINVILKDEWKEINIKGLTRLLNNMEPFTCMTIANILLTLSKRKISLKNGVEDIIEYLKKHKSDNYGMGKGDDFEEKIEKQECSHWSNYISLKEAGEKDPFFNLDSITRLMAMAYPAYTTYRLALTLGYVFVNGFIDSNILKILESVKDVNRGAEKALLTIGNNKRR